MKKKPVRVLTSHECEVFATAVATCADRTMTVLTRDLKFVLESHEALQSQLADMTKERNALRLGVDHLKASKIRAAAASRDAYNARVRALQQDRTRLRQALEDIRDSIGTGPLNVLWLKRAATRALAGSRTTSPSRKKGCAHESL